MSQSRIIILGRPGVELPENIFELLGQIVAKQNSVTDVIDETESTPVLEDVPEDPEVTIERLNTKILELEAELEEHRRAVGAVVQALVPLAAPAEPQVAPEPSAPVSVAAEPPGTLGPIAPPVWELPELDEHALGTEQGYAQAKFGAGEYIYHSNRRTLCESCGKVYGAHYGDACYYPNQPGKTWTPGQAWTI